MVRAPRSSSQSLVVAENRFIRKATRTGQGIGMLSWYVSAAACGSGLSSNSYHAFVLGSLWLTSLILSSLITSWSYASFWHLKHPVVIDFHSVMG